MRRGPRSTAAGRPTPGPSPTLAQPLPSPLTPVTPGLRSLQTRQPLTSIAGLRETQTRLYTPTSNRATRKTACCAGCPPRISNRHLVQLEFAPTPNESTTSLFLIDPNHRN